MIKNESKHDPNVSQVFLKPGEIYISEKPAIVVTILGSCVSVTMHEKRKSLGGICHGLLPNCPYGENCKRNFSECFKFVDCSIWHMAEQFEKLGAMRGFIEVGMYGGSSIMRSDIGRKNIEAAKRVLEEKGLAISECKVGGPVGRRLAFHTHTGFVTVRQAGNIDKSTGSNDRRVYE